MGKGARAHPLQQQQPLLQQQQQKMTDAMDYPKSSMDYYYRRPSSAGEALPEDLTKKDDGKASGGATGTFYSLYNAQKQPAVEHEELIETAPMFILITTYVSYLTLILVGHVRDFIDRILFPDKFKHLKAQNVISFRPF
jgi:hypothetical protein